MRLFLTGNPGVGNTTLIRAVLERLEGITSASFYTEEIGKADEEQALELSLLTATREPWPP